LTFKPKTNQTGRYKVSKLNFLDRIREYESRKKQKIERIKLNLGH